jgi:hypothetical protein
MTIATGNVGTTAGNSYTSSGNTAITFMSLCNHTAGNVIANVWVVPSGNSVDVSNQVLANLLITAGDTYQMYQAAEKLLLATGDTVQANANAANAISTVVSYTTI